MSTAVNIINSSEHFGNIRCSYLYKTHKFINILLCSKAKCTIIIINNYGGIPARKEIYDKNI